jgi:hypothetical protein
LLISSEDHQHYHSKEYNHPQMLILRIYQK